MIRFISFCIVVLLIDFYAYQSIKTLVDTKWLKITYIISSILILGLMLYVFSIGRQSFSIKVSNLVIGIFVLVYLTKTVAALVLFTEDISRFTKAFLGFLDNKKTFYIPARRTFISQLALGLAAIPFTSLLYGMVRGKYNFKGTEIQPDL